MELYTAIPNTLQNVENTLKKVEKLLKLASKYCVFYLKTKTHYNKFERFIKHAKKNIPAKEA